ncbi:MAG: 4-(cytidine 5'-diphospho)-2-C-methyl-D-erythritol kinase [Crocinitomicaceae bacterium]|nr:4-(cytidine 5'-diphospho)-2-C-methyl-D-erythritol kinase [Crocinitomicaceae bacterium]
MIYFPNAKINLGLQVVGRRKDGFHNLKSVFLPIGWCDILEVHLNEAGIQGKLNLVLHGLDIEDGSESNLVVRAHALLNKDFNLPEINVTLQKNIPSGAGLGGGSSDGSFMLKAINNQCKLGLDTSELENYASKLGSDCPFFIKNEPSSVSGRGEVIKKFEVCNSLQNQEILIVHPGVEVITREAFKLLELKESNLDFDYENLQSITNYFQGPVSKKFPEIIEALNFIESNGAHFTQMSGSGSAVFGLFDKDSVEGYKLVGKAKAKGWTAYFGALL